MLKWNNGEKNSTQYCFYGKGDIIMGINASDLLDYACEKFQAYEYEEALEGFVLAYAKGYEREWILENIYNCYMAGNEQQFRNTYERFDNKKQVQYEECILDFIPYREGEYYIFDKELQEFRGIFSMQELQATPLDQTMRELEFSAVGVKFGWDWNKKKHILADGLERKIYAICEDMKRNMSFYKIPELADYMENVKVFSDWEEFQSYFHKNTSVYFPKIFYGSEEEKRIFMCVLNQEHRYRLTPEGRNSDNILLTIGIPTHDRGKQLLQRLDNLRKLFFDAEIEIAISKNGSHYYQEEYKSAEQIQSEDARIIYVGCEEELTLSQNWRRVVEIARGKYVLLVSDEDDVILGALEHYLKLLNSHGNLGYVRAKTAVQYVNLKEDGYYKCGEDAFLSGFLLQNYLSGCIYNREYFMKAEIETIEQRYYDNVFYTLYPHMWWQAVISFYGDYAVDTMILVKEGEACVFEEIRKSEEMVKAGIKVEGLWGNSVEGYEGLTSVSEYQSRLEQFRDGMKLVREFEKFSDELKGQALLRFVRKTLYLLNFVRKEYHYKENEFPKYVKNVLELAVEEAQKLNVTEGLEDMLINSIISIVQSFAYSIED